MNTDYSTLLRVAKPEYVHPAPLLDRNLSHHNPYGTHVAYRPAWFKAPKRQNFIALLEEQL